MSFFMFLFFVLVFWCIFSMILAKMWISLAVLAVFFAWRILLRSEGFLDACLFPIRWVCGRYGWFGF